MTRQFYLILTVFLALTACSNQTADKSQTDKISADNSSTATTSVDSLPDETKNKNIKLATDATFPCQLSNPDTSVFNIILNNSNSTIKQIGNQRALEREYGELPFEKYCTQDKKQTLTLFIHPGGSINEFSEFEVTYYSPTDSAQTLATNSFVTNSGIKLGLSKEKVIIILGNCFKTVRTDKTKEIIKYHVDDLTQSNFLQRYRYPSYYAEYEFQNDKLARLRFGFEYP